MRNMGLVLLRKGVGLTCLSTGLVLLKKGAGLMSFSAGFMRLRRTAGVALGAGLGRCAILIMIADLRHAMLLELLRVTMRGFWELRVVLEMLAFFARFSRSSRPLIHELSSLLEARLLSYVVWLSTESPYVDLSDEAAA